MYWGGVSVFIGCQFLVPIQGAHSSIYLGPKYQRERLLPYRPFWGLTTVDGAFLAILLPSDVWVVVAQVRAFFVEAPKLWNSFLTQVCLASSLYSFS